MKNLILYKEKYSLLNLVVYTALLIIFTSILMTGTEKNAFYTIVWFSFMAEIFRTSVFNLHPFFAKESNFAFNKPLISRLRVNLDLLSIRMNDFIKFNVLYTFLRILPFIIVSIIFGTTQIFLTYMGLFTIVFLLKAYFGPIHSSILGVKSKILVESKECSKEERKELLEEELRNEYSGLTIQKLTLFTGLFFISYFSIMYYVFLYMYGVILFKASYTSPISLVIIVIGLSILLVYGYYLNHLEKIRDYELHQK